MGSGLLIYKRESLSMSNGICGKNARKEFSEYEVHSWFEETMICGGQLRKTIRCTGKIM